MLLVIRKQLLLLMYSGLQVRVGNLVSGALDVAGASPRRFFFEVLRHFATEPVEADRLAYFGSPGGREALAQYNQREGENISGQCLLMLFSP